jgi:hypothetical protein
MQKGNVSQSKIDELIVKLENLENKYADYERT